MYNTLCFSNPVPCYLSFPCLILNFSVITVIFIWSITPVPVYITPAHICACRKQRPAQSVVLADRLPDLPLQHRFDESAILLYHSPVNAGTTTRAVTPGNLNRLLTQKARYRWKTLIFNPLNPDPVRVHADPDSSSLYFTVPDTVPIWLIKNSVKL